VVVVVTTNALIPDTFPALERTSVAVRIPYPSSLHIQRSVHPHSHGFFPFVIAAGYTCYRDSANNAKCSLYGTNTDTITLPPPTLTYTTTTSRSSSSSSSSKGTPNNGNPNNGNPTNGNPNNGNSNGSGPNGSNGVFNSSSSSSHSPTPSPSEALGSLNGVADWKGPLDFFGIAPFFAWIGM
jgi:hypothetical protein